MWILDYITRNSITGGKTEQGSVKGSAAGKVEVNASSNFCKTPISSPYGIAYIMLYSKGGATLKLANDGNVYINGVRYQ